MSKNFTFSNTPKVKYRRSKFDLSFNNRFSASVGSLYPMYLQEVYPGDTFKTDANFVTRVTSAFLRPVMDNLFIDTYYFFVPYRLVNDKFANVMGENTQSAWAPQQPTDVAMLSSGTLSEKTVGDYLGLPPGQLPAGISPAPFRAFALIYNEWFRDQNNIDPVLINTTNTISPSEAYNNNAWSSNNYFGKLPKVAKFHDYFTTCLPNTQKANEPVQINVGSGGFAPVGQLNGTTFTQGKIVAPMKVTNPSGALYDVVNTIVEGDGGSQFYALGTGWTGNGAYNVNLSANNLVANLGSVATGFSVNDLRYAFAVQRLLEQDARGGTRLKEIIEASFGVISPDARLQRPEFLGGQRQPIALQQVAQTSQATNESPLASVGAYSLTNGKSRFTKSFVEHGFVIGVCAFRQFHTYQQGIEKFWTRSERYDFYNPVFAHISEQPVYTSELYGNVDDLKGNVFGYNEAWADLRYRPSRTAGEMRSSSAQSLDVWHFGDDYANAPVLGEDFINETPMYVDRTLAVPSTSQDQFMVDVYFKVDAYRVLPTYSVPSLIDHTVT